MNRKEYARLTNEVRRITVAKLCGYWYKKCRWWGNVGMWFPLSSKGNVSEQFHGGYQVPDYLNDLNAMHKAVAILQDKLLLYKYEYYLKIILDSNGENIPLHEKMLRAKASELAEAFVLTLTEDA